MPLTRPSVLPVWADAGDKTTPTNSEIETGWPLTNVPPSRQRFNWLLNFLMNGVRYLTRRGLPDWDEDETYEIGDRVQYTDGKTYVALTQNDGSAPDANPTDWARWGFTADEMSDELNNLDTKQSVRVASTANVAAISGLLTIDGVLLVAGNRVLLKDQSTPSQNGIYVVAAGAWSRATDADDGTKLSAGAKVAVEEGTVNADTGWMLTTNGTITIGATSLTFEQTEMKTSTLLKSNVSAVVSASYFSNASSLTISASEITPVLTDRNVFTTEDIDENITLNNPASIPGAGQCLIYMPQNATGGWTLTLDTQYKLTAGEWSTTASAVNILWLTFDGSSVIDVTIAQRGA